MQLRPYQSEAVEAVWSYLCGQAGSPLVVLPTGAGKSLVVAKLAEDAVTRYGGRVLVLAHRKELLEQNAEKIRLLLPRQKVGLFSAGLRRWEAEQDIVCAGIQSCWKKAEAFGPRHLVIIDEVHLVQINGEGMYRQFIAKLGELNPKLRLVGLTATPFRTGEGSLCGPDLLFQRICYNAEIKPLIDQGYLCPVISPPVDHEADTSRLRVRGGEFVARDVEDLFDQEKVTQTAVAEIVARAAGRRSILIFAAGVKHAHHVAEELQRVTGEDAGVVTGETTDLERRSTLVRFKNGWLRWLVNVDVLTTGYDAPNIDCIAILRATQSPGLFAQVCGRGFRLHGAKSDCLILDFGGNVKRHGPLDAKDYGLRVGGRGGNSDGEPGEAPEKQCPNCELWHPLTARECSCGFRFPPPPPRHEGSAGNEQVLAAMEPPRAWCVEACHASEWQSKKNPGSRTLRVDYECVAADGNMREVISEWVCLEHDGFAGDKAAKWWAQRCKTPVASIDEAVELWNAGAVAIPRRILTRKEGRWWRVLDYDLEEAANPDATLEDARAYAEQQFEAATCDPWGDLKVFGDAGVEIPF